MIGQYHDRKRKSLHLTSDSQQKPLSTSFYFRANNSVATPTFVWSDSTEDLRWEDCMGRGFHILWVKTVSHDPLGGERQLKEEEEETKWRFNGREREGIRQTRKTKGQRGKMKEKMENEDGYSKESRRCSHSLLYGGMFVLHLSLLHRWVYDQLIQLK